MLISDGPNTYRAGFDGNENIVALVKGDGHLAASYEYGPFGEPLRTTGEYGEQNPFRFSSVYTDHETGMLSYGFRYYNPQTGSWLGRDALEEAGGLNLSQFVFNNPLGGLDILGLGTYRLGTVLPPKPPADPGSGAHGTWKPYWKDYLTYEKTSKPQSSEPGVNKERLQQYEKMMHLTFPVSTRILNVSEVTGGLDDALYLKVEMDKQKVEAFLKNSPFANADLRNGQRLVNNKKDLTWWNPEAVKTYKSGQATLPKNEVLNILIDFDHDNKLVIYLMWHET